MEGLLDELDGEQAGRDPLIDHRSAVSANPPVICFCPLRRPGSDPYKDTLRNISATSEFVVSIVSEEFAEKMNVSSAEFPPEVDEFEASGSTPIPSHLVKPPRVTESHVHGVQTLSHD